MLVNREGFVTDRAFDVLLEIVRRGIDLTTRTRVAAKAPVRTRKREEREKARQEQAEAAEGTTPQTSAKAPAEEAQQSLPEPPPTPVEVGPTLPSATAEAAASIRAVRELLSAGGRPEEVSRRLKEAGSALDQVAQAAERVQDLAAMLRVLSSLGTQMANFVHEIRSLLGTAISIHEAVGRLRSDPSIRGEAKRRLSEIYQSLGDMRQQIERQAAYLIDITSPDARRRRSRQRLDERFNAAAKLVMPAIERKGISLANEIPSSLKSPPMFPAELTVVFSNLLTNAIKAAGTSGQILARGGKAKEGVCFVAVENTGVSVDLSEGERWFEPFESTTTEVDPLLGQGMGLGLTITRDLLDQYGATIRFIEPQAGYSTAVEIRFPE